MDITPATQAVQPQTQTQTRERVAVSVLRKALDLQAEQGAELAKMVAEAGGVGTRVDLYA